MKLYQSKSTQTKTYESKSTQTFELKELDNTETICDNDNWGSKSFDLICQEIQENNEIKISQNSGIILKINIEPKV